MGNEQLDMCTLIILVVVAIIGTILLWVGVKNEKRLLRFCGIGFLLGAGVLLFVKSTELRQILTPLAAVFAVLIAALSIEESRRLRQDSFDRESRDRNERRLKEIINWATQILICGREISAEDFVRMASDAHRQGVPGRWYRANIMQVISKYNIISWNGTYIQDTAEDIDQSLYNCVRAIRLRLPIHTRLLRFEFDGKIKKREAIGRHRDIIDEYAKTTIKKAVELISSTS